MRRLRLTLITTLLLAEATSPLRAAPLPLNASIRAEVLDKVVTRITSTYVDESAARLIGEALRARQTAHAYDQITNPAQFADTVTRDLRSVNGDLHLSLAYSGAPPSSPGAAGGAFGDPRLLNFGMGRAEILDGNIGYLEITAFTGGDYQDAVVDALRFLSRTEALIIDVRRNRGGASDMSHFIFSHFLGATPVPTIDVRTRSLPEPNHRMSLDEVPGPRRVDVPLFVLTSQGTASAAEEFCFVLQNQRRAIMVGTRTAGAGHMVASLPVGNGFTVSVSITRVSDPKTGREWEQVGVQPDIPVAPEQALLAAHAAALKAVLRSTADTTRAGSLSRLLETVEAKGAAAQKGPASFAGFAGTYEGRIVSVRDGQLLYARRNGALSEPLTPLGGDVFALSAVRFRFAASGKAMTLTIEQADGTQITLTRTETPPA